MLKCCCGLDLVSFLLKFRRQYDQSVPLLDVRLYGWDDESSNDEDDNSTPPNETSDCVQITTAQIYPMNEQNLDESEAQFLGDEIDENELKIDCQNKIKIIQDDMADLSLTPTEKRINLTNLKTLEDILSNIKLSEKLKLGSLRNTQYTDAVILQKQIVCNLAGQKEYNEIIRPVSSMEFPLGDGLQCQTPRDNFPGRMIENVNLVVPGEVKVKSSNEITGTKSILKSSKTNTNEPVAAM